MAREITQRRPNRSDINQSDINQLQPGTPKQQLPRPRELMQLIFATMRLKRSTPKRRNAQSFVEIFLIQMGRSSSTARDANRTTPTRDGQIIAQNTTPSIPKWMVKHMQTTVIKMMMVSLEASCSQKQRPPLRRSRSQKQRLPPRRQVAWRRDRKRFSYCLVCISSAISIPSSRFHSFPCIFIHFHISSLFHFHFHFHFQYTPRSDMNQSIKASFRQRPLSKTIPNSIVYRSQLFEISQFVYNEFRSMSVMKKPMKFEI